MPFRMFAPTLESNIRGGEKTVHIVYKYLSGSLLAEVGVGGRVTTTHTSQLIPGYSLKDDVTVILR
jgi:hypothetical protein